MASEGTRSALDTGPAARTRAAPGVDAAPSHVLACLDGSRAGEVVLPHAVTFARCFGARLTLLHVLEPRRRANDPAPTDPFLWEMRREEAKEYLRRVSRPLGEEGLSPTLDVAQGRAWEQVRAYARSNDVSLAVLSAQGENGFDRACLGATARSLVHGLPGSVLLVPAAPGAAAPSGATAHYARVLVPLDGSPRAESVLPLAAAVARFHEAELVLLHAVPAPELTRVGPPSPEDLELERRVRERNARVGEDYLSAVASRLQGTVPVRTLLLDDVDVRGGILRAVEREGCDLVVACAHGAGGCVDRPVGSVAADLCERSRVPLLLVRDLPTGAGELDARRQAPRYPGLELPEEA